jgi:FAD/FMN-containing dehydrogenase
MLSTVPIADLRDAHRGPLIVQGDAGYDSARETFNALTDSRPTIITRPVDSRDVSTALRFARTHGLPVSVRGGGHSVAGHCVGDASLMIDLRLLRDVRVDVERRTATVGGGACWSDVDARTNSFGLALPGGTYGDTGVGGLALTGGIGHLTGLHGMTLDNILALELVTANGDVVRASADEEPDLFWALRGGGGNFGVVTAFTFRLHEVGVMTGGALVHGVEAAPAVLRAFRDMTPEAPAALTCMPQFLVTPLLGEERQVLFTSVAYVGLPDEAASALAPLREAAPALLDAVAPTVYTHVQAIFPPMPFGLRNYWSGRFLEELPDTVIDGVVERFAANPVDSWSAVLFEPFHGAVRSVDPEASAFAFRNARFNVSAMAVWADPADDERELGWAAGIRDLLAPLSSGGYLNYSTDDSSTTVRAAFGAERFRRLAAIKARWDPDNTFRFNHNIPPEP